MLGDQTDQSYARDENIKEWIESRFRSIISGKGVI